MTRYRNYRNPYSVDVKRLSIYSTYTRSSSVKEGLSIGDEVTVKVSEVDSKGLGVAYFKGVKIVVPRAMIGEKVRVRLMKKVSDKEYVASVVERLGETW